MSLFEILYKEAINIVVRHINNEDHRGILYPLFMFGLYLPMVGLLMWFYYYAVKPKFNATTGTSNQASRGLSRPSVSNRALQYTPFPLYWFKNKAPFRIQDITQSDLTHSIKHLVYNLWVPHLVGQGRDAQTTAKKYMKITQIERNEHLHLYAKYHERKLEMEKKKKIIGCFNDIAELSKFTIETTEWIKYHLPETALEIETRDDLNEHLLFHGTHRQHVDSICTDGLQVSRAKRTMFGSGVYFAENPTKADQYTDTGDDDQILFLFRVCLGEMYIQKSGGAGHLKSPPCRTCYKHRCTAHKFTFDSTVADLSTLKFREFVLYGNYCAYPEYIIRYQRVDDDSFMRPYMQPEHHLIPDGV